MRKYLIILAVLLFSSFIFNLFFVSQIFNYYNKFNKLRLSPLHLDSYDVKKGKYKLLIYGDSHAENWKNSPLKKTINLGVGGQTSKQLLLRSDYHLDGIESEITLLFVGSNDIRIVASFPDQEKRIVNDALSNILNLIRKIDSDFFIVCTIPPIFELTYRDYALDYQASDVARQRLNDKIRSLSDKNVLILDTTKILNKYKNLRELSSDGLHINEKVYELLNERMLSLLTEREQNIIVQ